MPRGRKARTPEEKAAALAAAKTTKNITVDADLVDALNSICDSLVNDFGFRPTLSQCLRYLIRRARKFDE